MCDSYMAQVPKPLLDRSLLSLVCVGAVSSLSKLHRTYSSSGSRLLNFSQPVYASGVFPLLFATPESAGSAATRTASAISSIVACPST
jgi:hypothetical protein